MFFQCWLVLECDDKSGPNATDKVVTLIYANDLDLTELIWIIPN